MHPAIEGQWSDLIKAPGDDRVVGDKRGVYAVHAALLHTGKVLLFSGRLEGARSLYEGWVWEPGDPGPPGSITTEGAQEAFTATAERAPFNNVDSTEPENWLIDGEVGPAFVPGLDLFCAHQCQLEDGQILVTGGASANQPGDASGLPAVYTFDPLAPAATGGQPFRNYWTKRPDMGLGRWYPTNVMLTDGRVAVFSGRPNAAKDRDRDGNFEEGINPRVEIIGAPDYCPQDLGADADRDLYIYPGMHLVRGGNIFYTGTSWAQGGAVLRTVSFEMTGAWTGKWVQYDQPGIPGTPLTPNIPDRQEGMSLILPPAQDGKLILIGGSRRNPNVQRTDAAGNLQWQVEGTDLVVWTHPTTGVVVLVQDDGADVAAGGTVVPGEHGHGELEGGTGALAGVAHVAPMMEYGGITPASNPAAVEILHTRPDSDGDPSAAPVWEYVADLNVGPGGPGGTHVGRVNVHAVLLPDSTVCVIGGQWDHKGAPFGSVLEAEIFDPQSATSTTMAPQQVHRGYHATALLLPDSRVLVAGSGRTLEFFSPPYLFKEPDIPRLKIDRVVVPDGPERHARYGGTALVAMPDGSASQVRKVVLVRPGAVTHHTDSDQRIVPVSWSRASGFELEGDILELTMPNDASVAPPGYYMILLIDDHGRPCEEAAFVRLTHRHCTVINNRSTFGKDEVTTLMAGTATAVIDEALYVHVDGFLPGELGIGRSLPTGSAINSLTPNISPSGSTQMELEPKEIIPERPDLDPRLRQRFTFAYNVRFTGTDDFPDADVGPDRRVVTVNFDVNGHRCTSELRLIDQPNPYMTDGPVEWLSVDLRIFSVKDDQNRFGRSVSGDPSAYIIDVVDNLELAGHDFDDLRTEQDESRLSLATHKDGKRVWNFAVAQVRYVGSVGNHASNVRCHFRMFQTAVANMAFQPTTYPQHPDTKAPLLGVIGGELATIPFFAHPRAANMKDQVIQEQQLEGTGAESVKYFGVWLDINSPTDLRFPDSLDLLDSGPFSAGPGNPLRSIQQQLVRGAHQCLVAEIAFGDLVDVGDTPASSDKLAQRNIAYLPADNPGSPTSRAVHHTFDLQPIPQLKTQGLANEFAFVRRRIAFAPDELQIFWGSVPSGSTVEMLMPNAEIDLMLEAHRLRASPDFFERVGPDRLSFLADGATHLPIIGKSPANIAGLMTIRLPDTVTAGEEYRVVARHIHGPTKTVLGAFEFNIPVMKRNDLIAGLVNTYAVLKWIAPNIPASSRWHAVFNAYVSGFGDRLIGLGVWPNDVVGSPAGTGLVRPTRPGDGGDPGDGGGDKPPGRDDEGGLGLVPDSSWKRHTGVVSALIYDCHGHFEGFVLDRCPGELEFLSQDRGIHAVLSAALQDHSRVSIYVHPLEPHVPWRIAVHGH